MDTTTNNSTKDITTAAKEMVHSAQEEAIQSDRKTVKGTTTDRVNGKRNRCNGHGTRTY